MRSYFIDHWTGRLGFGLTVFVNLLGVSFVASSVAMEGWSYWAANMGLAGIAIIVIWQVVGGLRCASRLQKEQSTGNNIWGLYLGLSLAVVMLGFQFLDVVAARYFIEPRAKTIFGDDDFTVTLKGDAVHLGGEVNYLMYHALLIILSEHDDVKTISLESPGGIVFAGRTIGKLITAKGLETRVETYCYSVCTLVFAAGSKRSLQKDAEIGFHGYRYDMEGRHPTVDPIAEQKKDQVYLLTRGIDAGFLEHAFSTDAKSLWIPTHQEIYQAGFTTER